MNDSYDIPQYVRLNLEQWKNKRILLYGRGEFVRQCISVGKALGSPIVGILEESWSGEAFNGVTIFSWDDITKETADVLIIAEEDRYLKPLYDKVKYRCRSFHMEVYSYLGENLNERYLDSFTDLEALEYFKKNKEELRNLIDRYDFISFDLFDTLITRRVLEPNDIFGLLEKRLKRIGIFVPDFKKKRIAAERVSNGTFHNIYEIFRTSIGVEDNICARIMEEEILCEQECLMPRDEMIRMMEYAVSQGKRVSIISDMYFPEKVLRKILDKLGVDGYENLYVSCEYDVGKNNGLFALYKRDLGIGSYLHIGDNRIADGIAAARYGIDSYLVKSPYELLQASCMQNCLFHVRTLADRLLVGMLTANIFNDPFCLHKDSGFVRFTERQKSVNTFITPLVLTYLESFIKLLEEKKEYKGILFGARDGYLFKRLYEEIMQNEDENYHVPAIYFAASRKLCLHASFRSLDDVEKFRDAFNSDELAVKSLQNMMRDILPEYNSEQDTFHTYIAKHCNKIIDKSRDIRKAYLSYLESCGIDLKERYLFCEWNGSGTVQSALDTMFSVQLDGLYLSKLSWLKDKPVNMYTVYEKDRWNRASVLTGFLENVITSPEPSVRGIEEDGTLLYEEEFRSRDEIAAVLDAHDTIADFVRQYRDVLGEIRGISVDLADALLGTCETVVCEGDARILMDILCVDELKGWKNSVFSADDTGYYDLIDRAVRRGDHVTRAFDLNAQTWETFEKAREGKYVFLFGNGAGAKYFFTQYGERIILEGVIDNDAGKHGRAVDEFVAEAFSLEYESLLVSGIEKLKEYDAEEVVVLITNVKQYEEITAQLQGIGIKDCFVLLLMETALRKKTGERPPVLKDIMSEKTDYAHSCCQVPISEKKIVCFSHPGKYFDHGKYIIEALLKQRTDLDIVWIVEHPDVEIPYGMRKVSRQQWKRMLYELETAKIWIFDVEAQNEYIKRPGQIFIQTKHWASVTLKKFYLDAAAFRRFPGKLKTFKRNSKMMDYIITGSDFDTKTCRSGFDFDGKILQYGSPRSDALFQNEKHRKDVFKKYNIDRSDHVLLYAPTYRFDHTQHQYRHQTDAIELDFDRVKAAFECTFGGSWHIMLRLHPSVAAERENLELPEYVIDVSDYQDGQELAAASDVLMTDYSSIMFEPAFVKKPVFLFATDIQDYVVNEYELLIPYDTLPFPIAESNDELEENIRNFDQAAYEAKVTAFLEKYGVYEDGHASERAAKFISDLIPEVENYA